MITTSSKGPRTVADWRRQRSEVPEDDLLYGVLAPYFELGMGEQQERFGELTEGQRFLYSFWALTDGVESEGLHGYLWNVTGFTANTALSAARAFGFQQYARSLAEAWEIFPDGHVPEDTLERQAIIDNLRPEQMTLLEDIERLLVKLNAEEGSTAWYIDYINRTPQDFFV